MKPKKSSRVLAAERGVFFIVDWPYHVVDKYSDPTVQHVKARRPGLFMIVYDLLLCQQHVARLWH